MVRANKSIPQYLTPTKVARMLMLSVDGVRKWAESGELTALTTPGGHRRFLIKDIEDFAQRKGIVLQSIGLQDIVLTDTGKQALKILVVDDDQLLVESLLDLLGASFGEKIILDSACNGFTAGQKVSAFKPDLILLDERMSDLNGIEVCRRLKSDTATENIRVIGMTGYPCDKVTQGLINAGAECCFSKPLNFKQLIDKIGLTVTPQLSS